MIGGKKEYPMKLLMGGIGRESNKSKVETGYIAKIIDTISEGAKGLGRKLKSISED